MIASRVLAVDDTAFESADEHVIVGVAVPVGNIKVVVMLARVTVVPVNTPDRVNLIDRALLKQKTRLGLISKVVPDKDFVRFEIVTNDVGQTVAIRQGNQVGPRHEEYRPGRF